MFLVQIVKHLIRAQHKEGFCDLSVAGKQLSRYCKQSTASIWVGSPRKISGKIGIWGAV